MSTSLGGSHGELSHRARWIIALVLIVTLTLLWVTHRGPVGDIPERHNSPPQDTTEAP